MIENLINKYQKLAPNGMISAIKTAADKTGIDFDFLMEKASAESNFKADAKAKTSSATGLFQFIESTWLDMIKRHGGKYGLENYANKIECKDGKLCVNDISAKDKILELRKDPEIASLMAAEFSAENKSYLEKNTNSTIGATELYLAHFMGARGAAEFINQRLEQGNAKASELFIKEARANKGVFFDSTTGNAKSLDEVYNFFDKKFSSEISDTTKIASNNTINTKKGNQFRQQGNNNVASYLTHTHAISLAAVPVHLHTPQPSHTFAQAPLFLNDMVEENENYLADALQTASKIYAQSIMMMAKENLYKGFYAS